MVVINVKIDDYEIPAHLHFSKDHLWAHIEGDKVKVGLTDYAQKALHEIVFIDVTAAGLTVTQAQALGTVESVKAVSEVLSPVSGEVTEVNGKISSNPELVNKDPYGEGWIAVIKSPNIDVDLKNLMTAEQYAAYVKQQLEASKAPT